MDDVKDVLKHRPDILLTKKQIQSQMSQMDDVEDVLKHWPDIFMTKNQIQSQMSPAKFLWFVPLVDISPHRICSPATMGLINGKNYFFC